MDLESLERSSGINRVVNATPQQEAEVLKHFHELFERNGPEYYEREKNEAEGEIIRDVLAQLPDCNSSRLYLSSLGIYNRVNVEYV